MFDIGWMELMVIGVVALVVIGPRDLPEMFRQIGRVTAKLRQMAREFSRAMEQAANESGVNEVRKDLKSLTNPVGSGLDSLKSAADRFEKWDPVKAATKAAAQKAATPAASTPAAAAPAPEVRALGPETAALAAKKAAKRAAAKSPAEAAAAPAATPAATPADAAPAAPARKRGGRTRAAAPKDSA